MNDLDLALALALDAAGLVLQVYQRDFQVETKDDGSPVTLADRLADQLIRDGLGHFRPHDTVLTEESGTRTGDRPGRLWLIDPLDGTADFADRTDDFAVMIGLCVDGHPILGVIAAPALGRTWAAADGQAFEIRDGARIPLHLGPPHTPPRVLVSRKHPPPAGVQTVLNRLGGATHVPRGSVGVKCGLLAAGEADLYLHPSRGTWLWDCAAPQALIEAAGGRFTRPDGSKVPYDLAQLRNDPGVLVAGLDLHGRAVVESP